MKPEEYIETYMHDNWSCRYPIRMVEKTMDIVGDYSEVDSDVSKETFIEASKLLWNIYTSYKNPLNNEIEKIMDSLNEIEKEIKGLKENLNEHYQR